MPNSILTLAQKRYIRKNYLTESVKGMSRKFGLSPTPINTFMRNEGLIVPHAVQLGFKSLAQSGKTTSTPDIDRFLKKNYLKIPIKTIAPEIGKSASFVKTRLRQLGLEIPAELAAQRRADNYYKPGVAPFNKGKKVSKETYKKMSRTMFKKGNIPANAKQKDGVVTIRHNHHTRNNTKPYKYIRLGLGKWELYHRYKWEKYRGPIPKSHVVWFKDGDTMNTKISNLELIHRGEAARRNADAFRSLPEPLQKAKKLINKITTKIEQHEKQNH